MPGKKNYLDEFLDWMIRTGRKPKKREKPSLPMARSGAWAKFKLTRRMLCDLGYVKGENGIYVVWPAKGCKRLYNIKPDEFVKWIIKEFPTLENRQEKQRKGAYVFAAWKFGEYLHWELKNPHGKPLWTREQLLQLKEDIYPPTVKRFEVEVLPLKKVDPLLKFIKTRNLTHYTMIYLSRWLGGMRYQEVVNAPKDLDGPTLKVNFKTNEVTIWGKGEGGLQKPRYPTILPHVKQVLKEYLKYREQIQGATEKDDKYLFLTRFGKKFSNSSRSLNDPLRYHAKAWGKLTAKEISLISTHRIGRHGFITHFYPLMPEKLLMEEAGIEDPDTLHPYANISKEERAIMMKKAMDKSNGNNQPHPEKDKVEILMELFDIPREKAIHAMELLS